MKNLCRDLASEHDDLDKIVCDLSDEQWLTITSFNGWTIKDEIGHLAYFDDKARLAVTDPAGFNKHLEEMINGFTNFDDHMEQTLEKPRAMSPAELMKWWRDERAIMIDALEKLDPKERIPWYGPPMGGKSFITARLMETWAHGQDVADTLGVKREPTIRLKHIAHLGFKTYGWSFKNRQIEAPEVNVQVELESPDGEVWQWGEKTDENCIRGLAEDFCLVVTQRRNVLNTGLKVEGDAAKMWMELAQVFAGPPENMPMAL
jgi:uncharacterized protein (TIGR03084 family)